MHHHYTRRTRLVVGIIVAQGLSTARLIEIIRNTDGIRTPLARLAALRELISRAPFAVTRGMVYRERKRAVRLAYGC